MYNNSSSTPDLIAKGESKEIIIFKTDIWNNLTHDSTF